MSATWTSARVGDTFIPDPVDVIVAAALSLRALELAGQFQTDAWHDAFGRLRDAADRIEITEDAA